MPKNEALDRAARPKEGRPILLNFKVSAEEHDLIRSLALESAESQAQLLRRLVRKEKRVRANKRSVWSKKMKKVLIFSQRKALRDILESVDWKKKAEEILGGEAAFLIQAVEDLFDDL